MILVNGSKMILSTFGKRTLSTSWKRTLSISGRKTLSIFGRKTCQISSRQTIQLISTRKNSHPRKNICYGRVIQAIKKVCKRFSIPYGQHKQVTGNMFKKLLKKPQGSNFLMTGLIFGIRIDREISLKLTKYWWRKQAQLVRPWSRSLDNLVRVVTPTPQISYTRYGSMVCL